MVIWRPAYANRYEVQRSVDFKPGVDVFDAIDRALMSSAEDIEGGLGRVFYPSDDFRFFDWPNQGNSGGGQYADPWRYWMDENDIVAMSSLVAGGVSIPLSAVFLRPWENPRKFRPYYTNIELDRSLGYSFGNQQQTPQYSIAMGCTWGYGADADPAGTLAASVLTADPTITVSDSSKAGPGDVIVLGYGRGSPPAPSAQGNHAGDIAPYLGERCLITGASAVATGLTQSGSGVTTAQDDDQQLQWTGTGALNADEVITLDAEDMFIEKIIGSVATVRRAFNGTTLASHSGAVIYAMRQWQVLRAQLGTTASSYSSGAAVVRHRVPQLVRDLAIGVSEDQVMQEGAGYARTAGTGDNQTPMTQPVSSLGSKWMSARRRHGRAGNGSRQRTV